MKESTEIYKDERLKAPARRAHAFWWFFFAGPGTMQERIYAWNELYPSATITLRKMLALGRDVSKRGMTALFPEEDDLTQRREERKERQHDIPKNIKSKGSL